MKKSELRKIIRETIKEQFGGGNTMTPNRGFGTGGGNTIPPDCSQYTFPMGNIMGIGSTEWCDVMMNYYDSSYYSNLLDPWCSGEAEGSWGPFPQGYVDMMNSYPPNISCGMCYCLEQIPNTGTITVPPDPLGPSSDASTGQTMGMPTPATSPVRSLKKPKNVYKRTNRRSR